MKKSWLPEEVEINLFQEIKKKCGEAEAAGKTLYRLSIGQPGGPALTSARLGAAKAVLSIAESMHEYQDNGSPGAPGFAEKFVHFHVHNNGLLDNHQVDYLSVPGIKPMLGLVPLACGCAGNKIKVATTTKPGYPTPRDWCGYLGLEIQELPLTPENKFLFSIKDIEDGVNLIMMNYPHNPTGQIATEEWLKELCEYCVANNIRIFNDAAYVALSHTNESCALAKVAIGFPELSWVEAYSASKLIGNGTGWRVGAMVGSLDFIQDLKTIKGNTDSGFVAPMAAGVLYAIKYDQEGIEKCRMTYERRLQFLINLLSKHGMRLAVEPKAGFFTLWKVPKKAFGQNIESAEQFNFMMIERTGVVGVHFHPYIRYAVCANVMSENINAAFEAANVEY
ncbi:aminotransferase class I/II-fold pyridoxal phosphate-dependent enzyme [Patescibacteria group bacterium]|nr:aminotransferase class I/II-fold pyridoxal phosphate-dependent enzyme [Patescibacteria group bacterium]